MPESPEKPIRSNSLRDIFISVNKYAVNMLRGEVGSEDARAQLKATADLIVRLYDIISAWDGDVLSLSLSGQESFLFQNAIQDALIKRENTDFTQQTLVSYIPDSDKVLNILNFIMLLAGMKRITQKGSGSSGDIGTKGRVFSILRDDGVGEEKPDSGKK